MASSTPNVGLNQLKPGGRYVVKIAPLKESGGATEPSAQRPRTLMEMAMLEEFFRGCDNDDSGKGDRENRHLWVYRSDLQFRLWPSDAASDVWLQIHSSGERDMQLVLSRTARDGESLLSQKLVILPNDDSESTWDSCLVINEA